jgi:hypothetical protein
VKVMMAFRHLIDVQDVAGVPGSGDERVCGSAKNRDEVIAVCLSQSGHRRSNA